jgi:ATP-dependent Lon protease
MRDFRNAKAMAKTLREALAERSFKISHSESLELVSQVLGAKNWQTLSAAIEADDGLPAPAARPAEAAPAALLPVIPVRDLVLLPDMTVPLFAGRPKTLRAIERAMVGDRRLFIVAQRRGSDDDPSKDDLYEIGVVAQILQTLPLPDGSMKVVVQAERRARLLDLEDSQLLRAEVELVETPRPDESSQALAKETLERFARFANFDPASPPIGVSRLGYMIGYPGMFADLVTPHVATRIDQAQDLLATLDPVERLQKLMALMAEARKAA